MAALTMIDDWRREFEAFCRWPADATFLERFVRAFDPSNAVPPQYAVLVRHREEIAFEVAAPGTWLRSFDQFKVVVDLAGAPFLTVVLPDYFGSLASAEAVAARVGRPEAVLNLRRLRHMLGLTLGMLLNARVALMRRLVERLGRAPAKVAFHVSWEDHSLAPDTISLSRPKGSTNILSPDPFYLDTHGYQSHKLQVLKAARPWRERHDRAIWRGSTTGSRFDAENLLANERIRMCALCAERPDLFDAKITAVVQVAPEQVEAVSEALRAKGLLAPWLPMTDLAEAKFAIHIDGNSSAAGFYEKLSLGCCVLRVDSDFEQWFEPRLEPWTHFVPIRRDGSDLRDTVAFLIANPALAERIARAGFDFALDTDYAHEAEHFVACLCDTVELDVEELRLLAPTDVADLESEGWHGIERDAAGRAYRWTARTRLRWTIERRSTADVLEVAIPFVTEITPGFAARCEVVCAGKRYPVVVADGVMRARIPARHDVELAEVTLHTPALISPRDRWGSPDERSLGLGIGIA